MINSNTLIDKSIMSKIENMIEQYKFLNGTIIEYQKRLELLKYELINIYNDNGIVKHNGLKVVNRSNNPQMTVKELNELFKDNDLKDSLVVNINIEESFNSLMYVKDYSIPIVNAMKNKLETIPQYSVKEIVIER